jgi:N-dimethylarginine dimethylaminohydrolase
LFEKGKAIREAQKARMVQKARQEEQKRIQKALTKHGVALSPEVTEAVFGDSSQNAS